MTTEQHTVTFRSAWLECQITCGIEVSGDPEDVPHVDLLTVMFGGRDWSGDLAKVVTTHVEREAEDAWIAQQAEEARDYPFGAEA